MTGKLYNLDIWVYNRVRYFCDNKGKENFYGYCSESNESMAKLFDRHPNRISASVSKLIKEGYIKNNGSNKFDRKLIVTEKELNINGVTLNNLGVTLNKSSVKEITRMLKGINNLGVTNLTKAVLELNINGDIIKNLIKIVNIDINKEEKKDSFEFISDLQWKELFKQWIDYKKQTTRPLKPVSHKASFDKLVRLSKNDLIVAKEMIGNAIAGGWVGFHELDEPKGKGSDTREQKSKNAKSREEINNWRK